MSGGELTQKILREVTKAEGSFEAELPPLHESIEIDSLNVLLNHARDQPAAEVTVQFTYAGYTITVSEYQHVSIEE